MESLLLSVLSTALALALVLALAYGVLRALKGRLLARAGGERAGATDDSLHFVRALPVGSRERVVLIDYRSERWMLGVTAGGISVLARWPDQAEPDVGGGAAFHAVASASQADSTRSSTVSKPAA